ncbi:MAG TPA: DoxX family protein [Casimicrobiaceae bacterium]|nr:DoxX family protein [Casimicrobiaceae bacterium]
MEWSSNLGKLVLRLTLGGLMLLHGLAKVSGGIAPIVGRVAQSGLPPAFAYLVYVGEVLAPVLLIIGLWTRAAAALAAINMIVAISLMHTSQLGEMSKSGGWALELQAFYLFTAVAVMLLGAGRFSLGGAKGRLN